MKNASEMPLFFIDPEGKTVPVGFEAPEDRESAQDDLGGGASAAREGKLQPLSDEQKTFLGITSHPEWDEPWQPMSQAEMTLARQGAKSRAKGSYGVYQAPRAAEDASRFITNATILSGLLDGYEDGGDTVGVDIRKDPEAMLAIAQVITVIEGSAAGTWRRSNSKQFERLVAEKISALQDADLEAVLELARKVNVAQKMRSTFWRRQLGEVQSTDAYRAAQTDADLVRRYS